jgi:hypothetical protein
MNKVIVSITVLFLSSAMLTLLLQIQMTYHAIKLIFLEFIVIASGPLSSYLFYRSGLFNLLVFLALLLIAVVMVVFWIKLIRNRKTSILKSTLPVLIWIISGYGLSVWGAISVDYPHF